MSSHEACVCLRESRPTRARGLKLGLHLRVHQLQRVAPHAGAWIETPIPKASSAPWVVAPHAGAWIET